MVRRGIVTVHVEYSTSARHLHEYYWWCDCGEWSKKYFGDDLHITMMAANNHALTHVSILTSGVKQCAF